MSKAARKTKGKVGRPTEFTPEIAHMLCLRLMEGESLRAICADEAMPARRTVLYWLSGVWPEGDPRADFLRQYARAREAQAELYADDIIDIADADDDDVLKDAKGNPVPNTARLNRDRLRIDARKWVISRLLPRYAKKLVLEGGKTPIPVDLPVREMARRVIYLLREADPKFAKKDRT